MAYSLVYTADVHGNAVQYEKLVRYAVQISADAVIIGGDITPKGTTATLSLQELKERGLPREAFIATQRIFIEERLPELVSPLKEKGIKLYLLMGNDDCKANASSLAKRDGDLYSVIDGKRLKLTDDIDIVGYSSVPITPFWIKDWEKFDFSAVPQNLSKEYKKRKKANYSLYGGVSTFEGWAPFQFTAEIERSDSIQNDLSQEVFQQKAGRTVYVMHCPPNGTALDVITTGEHVGSLAERLFIEECQPYVTLHGHIHETVAMSGSFRQDIGKTVCLSPGNHNVGERIALLQFDLYDLQSVRRIII